MNNQYKILVTGGNGFLGKEVISQLCKIYDKRNIFSPTSSEFDLTIKQNVYDLFHAIKPDIVIHLAAKVGGILGIKKNCGQFFYDNVLMGLNLIDISRIYNINKFIFVSSGCIYPKNGTIPLQENEIWNGYVDDNVAAYAVAKKSLITMLQSYYDQYGLKSISLVPSNLYGPNDHFDGENNHVIPSLISRVVKAKKNNINKIVCWGSGNQTRDFLYVSDAASGIIKSIDAEIDYPTIINLGSGTETTIKTVTKKIIDLIDNNIFVEWDTSKPEGQPRRLMSIDRAKNILNWQPQVKLDDGLQKTIEFYYNHVN